MHSGVFPLEKMLPGLEVLVLSGTVDVQIRALASHVEEVAPGTCFFAIKGQRHDGHDFIPEAIRRGACAIVSDRPVDLPEHVCNVVVRDVSQALGMLASRVFDDPTRSMTVVGITGTNGKTTTSYLLESILKAAGRTPGVIGTIAYRYPGFSSAAHLTTPRALELQQLFAHMRVAGCDCCAMEVSSHALSQGRLEGVRFDVGVFTNLTPDHLDYHGEMESYFQAKARLFERHLTASQKADAVAVINADDPSGERLRSRCQVPIISYGVTRKAHVRACDMEVDGKGIQMRVVTPKGTFPCTSQLCGHFNVSNILAAVATAMALEIEMDQVMEGVRQLSAVPGRFEAIPNERGIVALVDYAHTPDALEKVLSHARQLLQGRSKRLIAVFGCGGDRDQTKRPLMGAVAHRLADCVILTNDNPRSEDPKRIIEQIAKGMQDASAQGARGAAYEIVPDRRAAIERAVSMATLGDVVVVAGKGHEDYQLMGNERLTFDDRQVVAEAFRG